MKDRVYSSEQKDFWERCMKEHQIYIYENQKLVQEQVPHAKLLQFLYMTRVGSLVRYCMKTLWFSRLCGYFYNSRVSKRYIPTFIAKFKINMEEALEPVSKCPHFNAFFYRKLKANARYIDPALHSFVAPCDSRVLAIMRVNSTDTFMVKSTRYHLISFLRSAKLADMFHGGQLFLCRLAPQDYHRYHFPTQGTVIDRRHIDGQLDSISPIVHLSAHYQPLVENERYVTIFRTYTGVLIAIVTVGALCVGSMTETYTPGIELSKGDEMGYFAFGGSLVALVVPAHVLSVDALIQQHSSEGYETKVKMGQPLAWFAS